MKCSKCGNKIETTFLEKIVGTIITKDGKKEYFCSNCQKTLK